MRAVALLCVLLSGVAFAQDLRPGASSQQIKTYFNRLQSQGAFLEAADGTFLGDFNRFANDPKSLAYSYKAGKWDENSIFNIHGKYGSPHQPTSAFSPHATEPPRIMVKEFGQKKVIGYLTTNKTFAEGGKARVYSEHLKTWFES